MCTSAIADLYPPHTHTRAHTRARKHTVRMDARADARMHARTSAQLIALIRLNISPVAIATMLKTISSAKTRAAARA
jgi:hypothetical protein